jgi:hypothetical protein
MIILLQNVCSLTERAKTQHNSDHELGTKRTLAQFWLEKIIWKMVGRFCVCVCVFTNIRTS